MRLARLILSRSEQLAHLFPTELFGQPSCLTLFDNHFRERKKKRRIKTLWNRFEEITAIVKRAR